MFMRLLDT